MSTMLFPELEGLSVFEVWYAMPRSALPREVLVTLTPDTPHVWYCAGKLRERSEFDAMELAKRELWIPRSAIAAKVIPEQPNGDTSLDLVEGRGWRDRWERGGA